MKKITLPITNGFYQTDTLPFSAQRCINMYPVYGENAAYAKAYLDCTPGIVEVEMTGDDIEGYPRGDAVANGKFYRASGGNMYYIAPDYSVTNLGSIATGDLVSMATNGKWLVIVVPGSAIAYAVDTTSDTLSIIDDVNFLASDTVVFIDGYFVFTASDKKRFFLSNINDPFNFDPLAFGTAESSPDGIIAAAVDHNQLLIFGSETIEFFQNTGATPMPFQRIPGALIEKGTYSRYMIQNYDNTVVFLGGGINELPGIYRINSSSSVVKISSNAIDTKLQQFDIDYMAEYALSFSYASNGAYFVGFTILPTSPTSRVGLTLVYDVTASTIAGMNVWHERISPSTVIWRVNSVSLVYNKLHVSYYLSGENLGYLSEDIFTEMGEVVRREVITQPFYDMNKSLFLSNLELTLEQGVLNADNESPEIVMEFSDDGARTWSNRFTRTIGNIGEYWRRTFWRMIGKTPTNRVFKFWMTEPVKLAIIKLEAYIRIGTR